MNGAAGYRRYVAIGDSQTEGLWDTDGDGNLMGFADRLAAQIDSLHPGLLYANLAVRGRRIADVLYDQLPVALSMRPDLITVCIGMNDATRPGGLFSHALADLETVYTHLADSGATVVTTTFPDIARIVPVGRVLDGRVRRINAVIRAATARHGFRLVDLFGAASMIEPATWSSDRVHGSARGHALFAAAAAEALDLPDSDDSWAQADSTAPGPSLVSSVSSQVLWTQNMLMPWVWRHMRGLPTAHGHGPRRPALAPVGN
ncbi:SGNH/GDSL hydrolase family protein [Mycolicibacterium sp. S2-37]|uniref:SGNH/GDSL hydrolase family protein n=1 Tax=Mycolicibacterium sp. S2-37 TaxID=2810297 RepID=UPI001A940A34|nr:SGNH/GDSL hydrolase family protein [Mycolicibacterium sp. S2-37]MBO0675940.1 SGNH/GDSL hydrolase family protein [Mycolicibacterium sp. S2-37]